MATRPRSTQAPLTASAPKAKGRPSTYSPEYVELARRCTLLKGDATDEDYAKFFGVSSKTIGLWKKTHAAFCEAIAGAKTPADASVANALFRRAHGYDYTEQTAMKIKTPTGEEIRLIEVRKHLAGDVTAQSLWLRNRRPDLWRAAPEPVDDESNRPVTGVSVTIQDPSKPKIDAAYKA